MTSFFWNNDNLLEVSRIHINGVPIEHPEITMSIREYLPHVKGAIPGEEVIVSKTLVENPDRKGVYSVIIPYHLLDQFKKYRVDIRVYGNGLEGTWSDILVPATRRFGQ